MVTSNSAGASAKQAYAQFVWITAASAGNALESIGLLASYYCDAPAVVGIALRDDQFVAKVSAGVLLPAQDLQNALFVAGESRETRDLAVAFASAVAEAPRKEITQQHAQLLVRGSHSGTWIDGYLGPSFSIAFDTRNDPLARFLGAYETQGVEQALAYLKGVAAVCALSARSVVSAEEGNLVDWSAPKKPTAAALGRLHEADLFSTQTVDSANSVRIHS